MDNLSPQINKLKIIKYEAGRKSAWDGFINNSKNGTFLFYRNYMEYHADRFIDSSLMFFDDCDKLIAVMPANLRDGVLFSHGGLTFGGIISDANMKVTLMLCAFDALKLYSKGQGIKKLIYKHIPHIYHCLPAEEDLYALFREGAKLVRRDVSSTLDMKERLPFSKGRKWALKQSRKHELRVERSYDFKTFMTIEEYVLRSKYNLKPIHTAAEIGMLADRFPENIKLFSTYKQNEMLAGVIIYESRTVAHAQYISTTDEGKRIGALDVILEFLINDYYTHKKYFDFGISTEDEGHYLNVGLIENKQSYGARAIVYDFYEIDFNNS